jgi:oxygen-independent coproporphyrinogen-3 oxidase
MFNLACEQLGDAGYGHYEVSNWALEPRFECRHNLGYWRKQPYLGLGAGAHSYRDGRRWWNVRPPAEYLEAVEQGHRPVGGEERLTPQEERLEGVFLKLRILEGVPLTSVAGDVATRFVEQGLLRRVDDHFVPTERGMLLLNDLVLGLAS